MYAALFEVSVGGPNIVSESVELKLERSLLPYLKFFVSPKIISASESDPLDCVNELEVYPPNGLESADLVSVVSLLVVVGVYDFAGLAS